MFLLLTRRAPRNNRSTAQRISLNHILIPPLPPFKLGDSEISGATATITRQIRHRQRATSSHYGNVNVVGAGCCSPSRVGLLTRCCTATQPSHIASATPHRHADNSTLSQLGQELDVGESEVTKPPPSSEYSSRSSSFLDPSPHLPIRFLALRSPSSASPALQSSSSRPPELRGFRRPTRERQLSHSANPLERRQCLRRHRWGEVTTVVRLHYLSFDPLGTAHQL